MNSRKIKKKKIHINKINKRMRELRRRNKSKRKKKISLNVYSLDVYDFLSKVKFGNIDIEDRIFVKNRNGIAIIKIPKIFSITNNNEQTIKILKKVYYYGCQESIRKIFFDHNECEELEIAASTIMDTIVMACKAYRKSIGQELIISGLFPDDLKVKKMFIASGLPAHLELQQKLLYNKGEQKLFSLMAGKNGSARSGSVSTKLTDYINSCLITQEFELTRIGRRDISRMFGEIIDNCEIHGGIDTTWYTLGHFDMSKRERCGEMNLVIFNYGKTVYEQLMSSETTQETRMKIKYMKEMHSQQYDAQWNEEAMLTLFSMQQGVSRLRDDCNEGNRNRGTGTAILIDTFYKLGNTMLNKEPEFSITSGHIHILFDKKYKLCEKQTSDNILGLGKIIAFNEENDILKKPDKNNIHCMKEFFPGTIISMKFFIDPEYLRELKGER